MDVESETISPFKIKEPLRARYAIQNESVIEGMISSAAHQAFDNHAEDTLEERLSIKLNSDNLSSSKDVTRVIAKFAVDGIPEWGIPKTTLPITFGRYQKAFSKTIKNMTKQKYANNPHVKSIYSSKFLISAKSRAERYRPY